MDATRSKAAPKPEVQRSAANNSIDLPVADATAARPVLDAVS